MPCIARGVEGGELVVYRPVWPVYRGRWPPLDFRVATRVLQAKEKFLRHQIKPLTVSLTKLKK